MLEEKCKIAVSVHETQEPLQRVSEGLVHSFEKLIFLPSVGGGVG